MSKDSKPQSVWVYRGPERAYSWPPMVVRDGETLAWPEIPAQDGCWSEASPGTEPTHGPDLPGPHRVWAEEELNHRPLPALREHWDPEPETQGEPPVQESQEVSTDA